MGNRFLFQFVIFATMLAVISVAAYVFASTQVFFWCLGISAAALCFFAFTSWQRRREIKRLTEEIDEVLNGGRPITLADYRENDVAVLANTLQKTTEKLARLTRLLSEEKTALADALADISHQIRTPLTAAELSLATIERTTNAAERKLQFRQLEVLLERISWLVTALLKMAKADAGALPFDKQQLSAAEVVRHAIKPLELAAELRAVEIILSLDVNATFTGDAIWCAEAIENIVKNALEATPAGGAIKITAKQDSLACRIFIEDTGSGISTEDLPHLFERFYRGARAGEDASAEFGEVSSPANKGFGIGLSLSKALIDAQGGTLRAENLADGTGARFTITFAKTVI